MRGARFPKTIQFKMGDPRHERALEILESAPRGEMAETVVKALLNLQQPQNPPSNPLNRTENNQGYVSPIKNMSTGDNVKKNEDKSFAEKNADFF